MIPREIFELINSDNLNFYKTCKYLYQFVDLYYRQFDWNYETLTETKVFYGFLIKEYKYIPYSRINGLYNVVDIKKLNLFRL
jgi:membrane protein YdbS with pleckstrin-like domain